MKKQYTNPPPLNHKGKGLEFTSHYNEDTGMKKGNVTYSPLKGNNHSENKHEKFHKYNNPKNNSHFKSESV